VQQTRLGVVHVHVLEGGERQKKEQADKTQTFNTKPVDSENHK